MSGGPFVMKPSGQKSTVYTCSEMPEGLSITSRRGFGGDFVTVGHPSHFLTAEYKEMRKVHEHYSGVPVKFAGEISMASVLRVLLQDMRD
jgi:hypothetical protein